MVGHIIKPGKQWNAELWNAEHRQSSGTTERRNNGTTVKQRNSCEITRHRGNNKKKQSNSKKNDCYGATTY